MKRLRVGVIELISDSVWQNWGTRFYGSRFKRHYASIMPQVVAVWCQQLGHDVTCWRSTSFITLPVAFNGSSSRISTARGAL